MTEAWPPLLLVLAGSAVYAGAHHLLIWCGGRGEALHLWAVAWCGNTILFLVSRYVQLASTTPEWVCLGARASHGSAA